MTRLFWISPRLTGCGSLELRETGTPHRLASVFLGSQRGVESRAGFQHCAGDIEQAVGDRSQGAAVTMAPAPQDGIFGSTSRIMLDGDPRPMVHGVGEPVVAGLPPDYDAVLPDLLVTGATPVRLRNAA